jgi:glutaredoxin
MRQQCYIASIYGSWFFVIAIFIFYVSRGHYLEAILLPFLIAYFLWLYVKYFPRLSQVMGYGSVDDQAAENVRPSEAKVYFYSGVGCPFCPLVKRRLTELQQRIGFTLVENDVTLKPDVLITKGIRALPVIEIGNARWVGNATSQQLAQFIAANSTAV